MSQLAMPYAPTALVAEPRPARILRVVPKPPPGSSDEWYTPLPLFEKWNREAHFNLDPCATAESAKCARYFTSAEDGLTESWAGARVFCNPPYSKLKLPRWVAKCAEEALRVELLYALLPSRTGTRWWQRHIEPARLSGTAEVDFLEGRLRFGWPGRPVGHPRCVASFDSALVIWRGAR